jgi:L-amino acid N-acyltransferase YncA
MLEIRAATCDDARAIAAIYRPFVEETTISFEFVAPDATEMQRRMQRVTSNYPWLVACEGKAVVGYAYASRHRERDAYASSVDVSIYTAERVRGKGLGTQLYSELLDVLSQRGDLHRAFAGIALPNAASVALHQKLGFTPIGTYHEVGQKFGRWIDVAWWERPLRPGGNVP